MSIAVVLQVISYKTDVINYSVIFRFVPLEKAFVGETKILFPPTCSLRLAWQASPTGNVGSKAANPVVSTPHRLQGGEDAYDALNCRLFFLQKSH